MADERVTDKHAEDSPAALAAEMLQRWPNAAVDVAREILRLSGVSAASTSALAEAKRRIEQERQRYFESHGHREDDTNATGFSNPAQAMYDEGLGDALNIIEEVEKAAPSSARSSDTIEASIVPSQRLASSEARPGNTTDEPFDGETHQRLVAPRPGSGEGVSQAGSRERPASPSALSHATSSDEAIVGNRDDRDYLRSLVRMDIRGKERGLAKFAPKPGQPSEEAEAVRKGLEANLEFRRGVYERLSAMLKNTPISASAKLTNEGSTK